MSSVYSTSAHLAAGPCYFRGAETCRPLPRVMWPARGAVAGTGRCADTGWCGRHGVVWPAHGGVAVPPRLSPCVAPGARSGCAAPCAGCAVAMEIACAVARQLKHPCLHTAMPRNAQLSSFPSPFCDLADMTLLALIPLHSVALLRFLGVNPVNHKKPAWHCKWGLWQ